MNAPRIKTFQHFRQFGLLAVEEQTNNMAQTIGGNYKHTMGHNTGSVNIFHNILTILIIGISAAQYM